MAAQYFPPLQIDNSIHLPPIPGPLPADFFQDIPSDALASFSTFSGTRPLRSVRTPIPVHLVHSRSTTDDDIHAKAWSLLKEHPELAESVMIPPTAWKDLYNYFDAVDLWKEGPGFLFHVLGYVHSVNVTRFNCMQEYVRDWVSLNEEMVAKLSATEDVLDALTAESRAYFDIDNLTKGEVGALRSAIMWHRDGLQRRQESFRLTQIDDMKIRALRDPSIVSMERRRPYGGAPVNPQDYGPTHTYLRNIADHPGMNGFQAHNRSSSHYHNGDFTQSHVKPYVGAMPGAESTIAHFNGSQNNHLYGPPESSNDPRGGARDPWYSHQFGRQQVSFTGFHPLNAPVYVFNPQKPVGGYCGGNAAAEFERQEQISSYRPENSFLPARGPGRMVQVGRAPPKYEGISNDARLHYIPEYSQRRESLSKKMEPTVPNQPFHRPHWSRDGFAQACTVFVGGFKTDGINTDWVPRLLSECGKVVAFKSLGGTKNSGFVTFDNVESTFRAIERFNGFHTWESLRLLVAIPRQKSRDGSYPSQNSGDTNRSSSQNWSQESSPAQNRSRQYSDPRNINTAWSHSRESSFYTTPPKYHSPVENNSYMATMRVNGNNAETASFSLRQQAALHPGTKMGPAEGCFQAQLDTVAKAADYNSVLKEMTPRKSVKSGGSSGQPSDGRSGTVKKRKNWPSKSGFVANTSTQTPSKKSLATPKAGSGTLGGTRTDGLADSVEPKPTNSNRASRENSQTAPRVIPVDKLSPSQGPSVPDIIADVQLEKSSPLLSSANVKGEKSAGKLPGAVSHQSFQDEGCAKFNELSQNRTISLASSFESGETILSGKITPSNNSVKSSASNEAQNEPDSTPKRKRKDVKRFPKGSKSSKGSINGDSLPTRMVRISTEKSVGENSEESFSHMRSDSSVVFSHVRSDSEATTMSAFSSQGMPLKADESEASEDGKAVKSESTSVGNASTASSSPSGQVAQSVKQGGRRNQAKATSGDDVFNDNKKPAVEPPSESHRPRHRKANSGSSGRSSARLHDNQDGSPTPGKKVKPTSQRKEPAKKDMDSERNENDRAQLLVTQMLSDMTHWPELGSAKPAAGLKPGSHQRMVSVVRPLGQRVATPRPPRRDSSASAVSESIQNARGQTIESPGRAASNSTELWPSVRRLDLHRQSPSLDPGSPSSAGA